LSLIPPVVCLSDFFPCGTYLNGYSIAYGVEYPSGQPS
jgi:hypothetical protein